MFQILSNVLAFAFAFGVIVFMHEAGHYLAAKACGVRVLTFSVGFGRRIWSMRRGDTDYRVSLIPLGGYVSFAGQDPTEPSNDPGDYLNHPRWQRILILAAGPFANVVLALLLVTIVYSTGFTAVDPKDMEAVVGAVEAGSAGEEAGLMAGDRVVSIGSSQVHNWSDVSFATLTAPERDLEVEFIRDREPRRTVLRPAMVLPDEIGEAGLYPLVLVGEVSPGSAAEEAGVLAGDAILEIGDRPVRGFGDLVDVVSESRGEPLSLTLLREGVELRAEVVPQEVEGRMMIGVGQPLRSFTVWEAARESVRFNVDLSQQMFMLLGKLVQREVSLRSSIGGPIQIAEVSGQAARRGFRELLLFMAFISLNLCILNMLPIPVLDGGQITVLLVEGTMRRDLSLRLKERITQVGLVVIVMLMAMAIYFDLSKSLPPMLSSESSGTEERQVDHP